MFLILFVFIIAEVRGEFIVFDFTSEGRASASPNIKVIHKLSTAKIKLSTGLSTMLSTRLSTSYPQRYPQAREPVDKSVDKSVDYFSIDFK